LLAEASGGLPIKLLLVDPSGLTLKTADAKNGVAVEGGEIYTTASPCWNCFKLIANAGIRRIYYGEFYREERSIEIAKQIGIELIDIGGSGVGNP